MTDEIERLRKHVEFHKNSERAMFTIAGLKALLEAYDAAINSFNEMSERFRAVNVEAVARAVGEDIFALRSRCEKAEAKAAALRSRCEKAEAKAATLEAQVKRLLTKERDRIASGLREAKN